jgi:DNA processing protein
MPLDWEPRGRDFPRRNRVVSGLSLGVIVVEAARRSGSLITARFALEQGRELFAVPGSPVDPRAEGPNDLLREGATLATCVEDIISVLSPLKSRDTAGAGEIEQGTFDGPPLWDELDLFAEAVRTRSPAASWDDFAGSDADYAPVEHEEESSSEIVLALVGTMPISLDEIIRASGLAVPEVRSSLVELELAGAIQRVDVDRFARVVTVDEFNAAAD